jgi:hypothetical protein
VIQVARVGGEGEGAAWIRRSPDLDLAIGRDGLNPACFDARSPVHAAGRMPSHETADVLRRQTADGRRFPGRYVVVVGAGEDVV